MTAALDREVRVATYAHFVETGMAPTAADVAGRVACGVEAVRESWERLAAARVLVLDQGTRALRMAMPFSAVSTEFRVKSRPGWVYANCAWDALGIPAMLGEDALIQAPDPMGGSRLIVEVNGGEPSRDDLLVHFAVPAARWWDDIGET